MCYDVRLHIDPIFNYVRMIVDILLLIIFIQETVRKEKIFKISSKDLSNVCYRSTDRTINYGKAVKYLLEGWLNEHVFFANIKHRTAATFNYFIQNNKQHEFERF